MDVDNAFCVYVTDTWNVHLSSESWSTVVLRVDALAARTTIAAVRTLRLGAEKRRRDAGSRAARASSDVVAYIIAHSRASYRREVVSSVDGSFGTGAR